MDFCRRYPADCDTRPFPPVQLTPESWAELNQVNREVNAAIREVPDGDVDVWSYPVDAGDCEDFGKRRPQATLLRVGLVG
ncbi:transglutaminase-like cysteine peptidase [Ancylobacter lacus]|nr:transglutaminase-like cysteine peptidase [Ancylobacter lacus]